MEIIAARYLFPISSEPLLQGAVAIEEDEILAVGLLTDIAERYPDAPLRRFGSHVLMPGLINAHTCLEMSLYQPESPPSRYIEWLVATLEYRRSQSAVNRRSAVLEGLQRSLAAGTTTLADVGNYSGLLDTVKQVGLRMQISPEVTAAPRAEQQALFDDTFQIIEKIERLHNERMSPGLAPKSPFALSRNLLKILAQHAEQAQLPLSIHAACCFEEMEFFYESKGEIADYFFPQMGWGTDLPPALRKTPIQFLESIRFLNSRPRLVGCTHLSDPDIETLTSSGSTVVFCPSLARHFSLGLTPIKKLLNKGITVAIGTEDYGASCGLTMWDALRSAIDFFSELPQQAVDANTLLRMASLDAAKSLQLESTTGSLEAGKKADFILVKTSDQLRLEEIPLKLIHETTSDRIEKVYVSGKALK